MVSGRTRALDVRPDAPSSSRQPRHHDVPARESGRARPRARRPAQPRRRPRGRPSGATGASAIQGPTRKRRPRKPDHARRPAASSGRRIVARARAAASAAGGGTGRARRAASPAQPAEPGDEDDRDARTRRARRAPWAEPRARSRSRRRRRLGRRRARAMARMAVGRRSPRPPRRRRPARAGSPGRGRPRGSHSTAGNTTSAAPPSNVEHRPAPCPDRRDRVGQRRGDGDEHASPAGRAAEQDQDGQERQVRQRDRQPDGPRGSLGRSPTRGRGSAGCTGPRKYTVPRTSAALSPRCAS